MGGGTFLKEGSTSASQKNDKKYLWFEFELATGTSYGNMTL